MIIRSKAPLRLGLAGGGTDVSPYSDMYGGLVLNATINLYAYCTIEETKDGLITINSYDASCNRSYPLGPSLPLDGEAELIKGVYNRVVRDFGLAPRPFRITTYNDAPAGSGGPPAGLRHFFPRFAGRGCSGLVFSRHSACRRQIIFHVRFLRPRISFSG